MWRSRDHLLIETCVEQLIGAEVWRRHSEISLANRESALESADRFDSVGLHVNAGTGAGQGSGR
jgi:hypothetical protein